MSGRPPDYRGDRVPSERQLPEEGAEIPNEGASLPFIRPLPNEGVGISFESEYTLEDEEEFSSDDQRFEWLLIQMNELLGAVECLPETREVLDNLYLKLNELMEDYISNEVNTSSRSSHPGMRNRTWH